MRPRIAQQPVSLALCLAVALHLSPPILNTFVDNTLHLAKANEGNRVVRRANLRAAAKTIAIINDATNVVLDALVQPHRYGDHALARELLQVMAGHVVVHLEVVDLKLNWGLGHLVSNVVVEVIPRIESALLLPVQILVVITGCQPVILRVVEGILGLTAEAANVREGVAINQLLLGERRDFLGIIDVVVAGVKVLHGSHSVVRPTRTTLLLILDPGQNFALLDPIDHWTMDELAINELVVANVHAQAVHVIDRFLIASQTLVMPVL